MLHMYVNTMKHVSNICWCVCAYMVVMCLWLTTGQVPPPRANEGSTPKACQTLLTYTLALWGILSVAASLSCFAMPAASVKSVVKVSLTVLRFSLGVSRESNVQ